MRVFLIRHGTSVANSLGLQNGDIDDPLSTIGVLQATALGSWFRNKDINSCRFLTSNWKRAIQTSEIIFPKAIWEIDPRIGETNAGIVAGMKKTEFQSLYPNLLQSHYNPYPGGESHSDLFNRVESWWIDLNKSSSDNENIICVAHSGSISCVLQLALGLGLSSFPAFLVPNCSISIVEVINNQSRIKLLSYSPDYSLIENIIYSPLNWP